jgi:hypothetical protein
MRLDPLEPISLPAVLAESALQERVDRKYVVARGVLDDLVSAVRTSHRVLEIDGRRRQRYDTVYFDSPGLGAYRAHLQGRRRRYKVRTRRYVETGMCVLELKLKDGRGRTLKERTVVDASEHGRITAGMRAFLERQLDVAYGMAAPARLERTLHSRFERVTLVARGGEERVTCDLDVTYGTEDDWQPGLDGDYAIVETKSADGRGPAETLLRALGAHPVAVSKYCLGIGLLRDDVHRGRLLAPVRHFLPAHA